MVADQATSEVGTVGPRDRGLRCGTDDGAAAAIRSKNRRPPRHAPCWRWAGALGLGSVIASSVWRAPS